MPATQEASGGALHGKGSQAWAGAARQRTAPPAPPHLLLQLVQLLLGAAVRGAARSTHISSQLRAHRLQLGQGWACQRLGCCVVGAAQRVAVGAVPADAVRGASPRLMHQRAPVCLAIRIAPGSEGAWACEIGQARQRRRGGGRPSQALAAAAAVGLGPHLGHSASANSRTMIATL